MDNIFGNALPVKRPLRRALFDEYGPADKRIKNLEKATYFRVDHCELQKGADGQPLSHVCTVNVSTENEDSLEVSLSRNVPKGASVETWIKLNKSEHSDLQWPYTRLVFTVKKGQQGVLLSLAQAIRDIVKPGRRYDTPSYKYTCPLTADALEHLEAVLSKAWASQ